MHGADFTRRAGHETKATLSNVMSLKHQKNLACTDTSFVTFMEQIQESF